MKLFLKNILILPTVFVNLSSFAANPPNPGIVPAPGSPIDENIWILIAVSIIYGTYKLYKFKNKKASS